MYANVTDEQKAQVVEAFRYALHIGATDPMHAAAIAASRVLCPSTRARNEKREADAFAAALAILVMKKEVDLHIHKADVLEKRAILRNVPLDKRYHWAAGANVRCDKCSSASRFCAYPSHWNLETVDTAYVTLAIEATPKRGNAGRLGIF